MVPLSYPYMTSGKTIALTRRTLVSKAMSLLFSILSWLGSSWLFFQGASVLISWLQSLSAVILEPKKIKSVTVSIIWPIYLPWSDGTGYHDLSECWVLSQLFHSPLSPSSRNSFFSSSLHSTIRVVSSAYLRLLIFLLALLIPAGASSSWHFAWCTLHIS